jgi:alpha-beta hydrolase superfamily lysophospholipase
MRSAGCLLALLAVAGCAACGGGSKQNVPEKPPPSLASRCGAAGRNVDAKLVWFRASDGTLLDGAAIGDGDVGVVLAHESPSDLCPWLRYAKTLAARGFLAFVFDLRGMGVSEGAKRFADYKRLDWDVEAAAAEVRRLGAKKVFLVGASAGGAAVLVAGALISPEPAGIVSLSGETSLPPSLDALKNARNLKAPLLLVVARQDLYVNVLDYQALKRAAGSRDKRLAVYNGAWHGWDLLYKAPYRSKVNALVLGFLNEYSDDGE